jgi:hypothetical protein
MEMTHVTLPIAPASAAARTLAVPEILAIVLLELDRSDHFHCSLVCKAWFAVALDALWREMDSAIDVFSILAPMVYNQADKDGDAVRGELFTRPRS